MADGTPSSHARRRAPARREAEEQPESEAPELADGGEKDQQDRPDKGQTPRRVPGLHGYDPSQWPDASL
jgi:hypothetical protein